MPVIGLYAALTAAQASAGLAFAITALTVVGMAALPIAATLVARNQQKKAAQGLKNRGVLITAREAAASHKLIYGQVRVGGTIFFLHTKGSDNHEAHILVVHAAHECAALRKIYLNEEVFDVPSPTADSAAVIFGGKAYIKTHLGWPGQGPETELVDAAPGHWTSSDTVTGHCYTYARLQWNSDVFPNGAPNITALIDGRKVYDPRDEDQEADDPSTWLYSNNAALCILDYLRDATYGLGCAEDEIDYDAFTEAANICDESVGGAARYTLNGMIDTEETPREILERMLTSCAGQLIPMGGVWRLRVGAARTPSAIFTLDHVRGPLSPQCGDSLRETCNGVKGLYVSAANQWQPADFTPVTARVAAAAISADALCTILVVGTTDFTAIGAPSNTVGVTFTATGPGTGTGIVDNFLGEDDGERKWRDIELPFTSNSPTAHRLARIELKKARQDITLPLQLSLAGLAVTVGDVIALPFARYGWDSIGDDGKLFEVRSWKLAYEQTEHGPLPYTELIVREYSDGFYSDDPDTTLDDAPNTNLPDPRVVETPEGLTLSADSYAQPDGNYYPRLKVEWDVPTDSQFIASGGRIRLEYKKHADSDWIVWSEQRGDSGVDYITDVVFGVAYDVRIQFENVLRVRSEYADSLTAHASGYTLAGDTTAPSAPTGLTAAAGTGKAVSLAWGASSADDFSEYRVYRHTSNTFGSSTLIAEVSANRFVDVSVTLGQIYYYWVTAVDYFENESTQSSSANATPTLVPTTEASTTAPSAPSAPTLNTSGNYLAGDGTLYARLLINVPSMPGGATILNLLYRRNGTAGWIVADQRSSGGGTTSIDDLSPAVAYEVAAQAFSAFGVGSTITTATSSPFTTPNSLAPSAPTGLTISITANNVAPAPVRFAPTGGKMNVARVSWTASASKDVAYYEIESDAFLGIPSPYDDTSIRTKGAETSVFLYNSFASTTPNTATTRVRAVNRAGLASSWTSFVDHNMTASYGTANMAEQSSSDVSVSGIKTGAAGASSVRKIVAHWERNDVVNPSPSGSPSGVFSLSIANCGFTTKPDTGSIDIVDGTGYKNIEGIYQWTHASNSSTAAYFEIKTRDGTNLTGAALRYIVKLTQYV